MYKNTFHIAVLEPSRILFEGIQAILCQSELDCRISRLETFEELCEVLDTKALDIVIANPMQFVNREKEVRKIRRNYPDFCMTGIDLGIVQKQVLALFDVLFTLYDSPEQITNAFLKIDRKNRQFSGKKNDDETLSEREVEVLTGLVNGMSNKEIADWLNISTHTVVSHRKNIAVKTGIRSQSGLTIYAISKRIISIEDVHL